MVKKPRIQPPMKVGIDPNTPRFCTICNLVKSVSEFFIGGHGYYGNQCKECHNDVENKRYQDTKGSISPETEKFWSRRLLSISTNAERRGIPCDLLPKDLLNLYFKQNGRCYYTGEFMIKISVDRIDHHRGYFPENIVLCENRVNNIRKTMPQQSFIEMCILIAKKHGGFENGGDILHSSSGSDAGTNL